ncbi:hypothetical protein CYMTET_27691 [Cymbomonas tetramitiformis]|uniref:Uncharacterized protein n=1 Tax=Cymbomonas tetramitiformis TaxID=36881 RepID=A0AAE0FPC0_9CHLO|nr:hypothetical protein CYMTET_27691 [Cymbomonas tetramitiformis]
MRGALTADGCSVSPQYEGKPHHVFEVVFFPYYAAWTIGYVVSVLAPRESASLIGVVVALLFAMRLSGTNDPTLKEIKDYEGVESWPYDVAFPRYGVEAFYVSAVRFYENVPFGFYDYVPDDGSAIFEGTKARQEAYKVNGTESIWMNIDGGLRGAGYDTGEYSDDLVGMWRSAWIWAVIGYICMALTNNDKKK